MVGERLSELRKDKGLTQKELAKALGISVNTVSAYERELNSPEDATEEAIARYFNVSLDYLHGLIDTPRSITNNSSHILFFRDIPEKATMEISDFLDYIAIKYRLK